MREITKALAHDRLARTHCYVVSRSLARRSALRRRRTVEWKALRKVRHLQHCGYNAIQDALECVVRSDLMSHNMSNNNELI